MKIFFLLIFTFFIFDFELTAGLNHVKNGNYDFYFEKNMNIYSLEYVIKLVKDYDRDSKNKFNLSNNYPVNVYLYNDTAKFMSEQNGTWLENYIIKSNSIALNNIDLLLQKNSLQRLLKYIIYRNNLNISFKNELPLWFINGLAGYFADKNLFENRSMRFSSLEEFNRKLERYTSKEEREQVNYNCYKSVKYLMENTGEEKILIYIRTIRSEKEFEDRFNEFFGMSYTQFIRMLLNL